MRLYLQSLIIRLIYSSQRNHKYNLQLISTLNKTKEKEERLFQLYNLLPTIITLTKT